MDKEEVSPNLFVFAFEDTGPPRVARSSKDPHQPMSISLRPSSSVGWVKAMEHHRNNAFFYSLSLSIFYIHIFFSYLDCI